MEDRPNPDRLLRELKEEEQVQKKGRLKIFFGYAAGVGKTYAMLDAAQADRNNHIDVAAGYVEPHARPDTMALLSGLEVLSPLNIEYKGIQLKEFDLDAALYRRPQLILVDELAHTNAAGCRHAKRYQDVMELLEAGIDVYTTVNVQHLESLNDIVASITQVTVHERIPDSVFDEADQVELVDIEPEQLIRRLETGKIYQENQAKRAVGHFFQKENLTALREIALRRTADRVNRKVMEEKLLREGKEYYTGEHILVCISESPTNAKVIRTAARMAGAFNGRLTALFVETPAFENAAKEVKQEVYSNMKLARQFGAELSVIFGDQIAYQIGEYAKSNGISKVILGRTGSRGKRYLCFRPSLIEKLTASAPNLDIYIIPDQAAVMKREKEKKRFSFSWMDFMRMHSRREFLKSRRTELLLNTSHKLRRAFGAEQILKEGAKQAADLLECPVAVYNTLEGTIKEPEIFFPQSAEAEKEQMEKLSKCLLTEDENAVAAWVLKTRHRAGRTTDTLPGANGYYIPVFSEKQVFAIYGIQLKEGEDLSPFDKNLLKAMVNETAFAAEKYVLLDEQKKILIDSEKDKLRANLLRAVSHDLRTPLSGITGLSSLLLENGETLSGRERQNIYSDIFEEAMWLNHLVENILTVTQLDLDNERINIADYDLGDVIRDALSKMSQCRRKNQIKVDLLKQYTVKGDAQLISRVIINIVDNSIRYTQSDSVICISAREKEDKIAVEVSDNGPGIADAEKAKIFDQHFKVSNNKGDSRRGLGLGLSLCRTIVLALGGEIYVKDGSPSGTVFGFTLQKGNT